MRTILCLDTIPHDETRGSSDSWSEIFTIPLCKCDFEAERTIAHACWCRAFYVKMEKRRKKTISIFQSAFFFDRNGTIWLGYGNLISFFFSNLFLNMHMVLKSTKTFRSNFISCFCWNTYYSLESLYFQTWRFIMVVLFLKGYSIPACFSRVYCKCIKTIYSRISLKFNCQRNLFAIDSKLLMVCSFLHLVWYLFFAKLEMCPNCPRNRKCSFFLSNWKGILIVL